MSTQSGKYRNHQFHGDPNRFESLAHYIGENFAGRVLPTARLPAGQGRQVRRVADVGGGQGMLARILAKKYNFEVDVIDPRGYTLIGVNNRPEEYKSSDADYYDLIIGLHPDEALKEVVYSAKVRPVIVIPCCNFWSSEETLGRDALLLKIEEFYRENNIKSEKITFDFKGPKNIGLVSCPLS